MIHRTDSGDFPEINTVNWSGGFRSTSQGIVHGGMWVALQPFLLMLQEAQNDYQYKTRVYLRYDGLYRYGQVSDFILDVFLSLPDGEISSSGHGAQLAPIVNFKAGSVSSVQSIKYTVTSFTPTRIAGTYRTEGPADEGEFWLEPTGDTPPTHAQSCIML